MSLWLALHFPCLPLEIYSRHLPDAPPLAISEQQRIYLCNEAARHSGIQRGQSVATAYALNQTLLIIPRAQDKEQAALEQLARWAGHYTSHVSLQIPASLALEIAGSIRYFDGVNAIIENFSNTIAELNHEFSYAVAPVPSAALLLAKARPGSLVREKKQLTQALSALPIEHLEFADPRISTKLRSMGITRLGDCLHLPRAGLARRFGQAFITALDRLLGHLADPRPAYQPPEVFRQTCFLPAETDNAHALLFACHRLLRELSQFLQLRGKGIQEMDVLLFHRKHHVTRFTLSLLKPSHDSQHLLRLLTEHLERLPLPAPVLEIQFAAGQLFSLSPAPLSLFADPGSAQADWTTLVERLRARLGQEAIGRLACREDWRPEQAWHVDPANPAPPLLPEQRRPLWLLDKPQALQSHKQCPCHEGPLQILSTMERVENGWWDSMPVTRDYFIARNAQGSLLWIYRDQQLGRWFLHGVFA